MAQTRSGVLVLFGCSGCQAGHSGTAKRMARTLQSTVSTLLQPVTPSHNGKTSAVCSRAQSGKRQESGGTLALIQPYSWQPGGGEVANDAERLGTNRVSALVNTYL